MVSCSLFILFFCDVNLQPRLSAGHLLRGRQDGAAVGRADPGLPESLLRPRRVRRAGALPPGRNLPGGVLGGPNHQGKVSAMTRMTSWG